VNTLHQNSPKTEAWVHAELADHYRMILQTIEGVIGTKPDESTDLNTLPERVAKALVRVPDVVADRLQPDPGELFGTIPPDVKEAALFVENWMKMNGHTRWAFYGIQSRGPDYLQIVRDILEQGCTISKWQPDKPTLEIQPDGTIEGNLRIAGPKK